MRTGAVHQSRSCRRVRCPGLLGFEMVVICLRSSRERLSEKSWQCEHVATGIMVHLIEVLIVSWQEGGHVQVFNGAVLIVIALKRELVLGGGLPVHAESALVFTGLSGASWPLAVTNSSHGVVFKVGAVKQIGGEPAAVAGRNGGAESIVPTVVVTTPPCVSRALLVMMLMTPFMALAPHSVPPGPRITSMRSRSSKDIS